MSLWFLQGILKNTVFINGHMSVTTNTGSMLQILVSIFNCYIETTGHHVYIQPHSGDNLMLEILRDSIYDYVFNSAKSIFLSLETPY